jgi:hypothetical protein
VQSIDPKGPGARLAITDGGSEFVGFFPNFPKSIYYD